MCLICDAGVGGAQVSAATGGWMNINFPRFRMKMQEIESL